MQTRPTRWGHAIRLDPGEEIVASLRRFALATGVRSGGISGIGAAGDLELGYFVRATGEYVRRAFPGEYEIGSLTGNFSDLEGEPFPHCHVVLGGDDFVAWTGHLFRGVVTVTCEIQVVTEPKAVRRVRRPDLRFNPIDLGDE